MQNKLTTIKDVNGVVVKAGDTIRWLDKDFVTVVRLEHDFKAMPDNYYEKGEDFLASDSPYGGAVIRIVKPKTKYNEGFEICNR